MMKTNYLSQKNILIVLLTFLSFQIKAQNNYTVVSIPFQPYLTSNLDAIMTEDDRFSHTISLPFSFDFYGTAFNQMVISTNGYISFESNLAQTVSPWSFNQSIPNTAFPVKNAILGCFHDLFNNNNINGFVTIGIYGTAPYRKFVVYFDNQAQFGCGTDIRSSFQMILHETSNIIDVQIIDRQVCATWQSGVAVSGLINASGSMAITPSGRNTGAWTAYHEGWRYSRPGYYSTYSFAKCDDNNDGFENFNLAVAQTDLSPATPSSISFYTSLADAQGNINPITNLIYTNISNPQTLYASGNGRITTIKLSTIDCTIDTDADTVPTATEDLNNDANLANDDTDADGMPNYEDNDDDGDMILTSVEYVIFNKNVAAYLDTDGDSILNYLDNDDDGDGLLTYNEDYNQDGNPANDDTNSNGTPDYLEQGVALGLENEVFSQDVALYPNPAKDILNIKNHNHEPIYDVFIYAINGALVRQIKGNGTSLAIPVSDLQKGFYFLKVEINNRIQNYKFIKE